MLFGLGELLADITRTVDTEYALTPAPVAGAQGAIRSAKSHFFQKLVAIPLEGLKQSGTKEHKVVLLRVTASVLSAAANGDFLGMATATDEETALFETLAAAASVFAASAFDAASFDASADIVVQLLRIRPGVVEELLPDILKTLWSTSWDTVRLLIFIFHCFQLSLTFF